jgi:hypothetical protein
MTERRSKFPPLMIDGVDINEACHLMADQALVEVEIMKTSAKRLRAAVDGLFAYRDAGAQLPSDLLDQISTSMSEFLAAMANQEGSP